MRTDLRLLTRETLAELTNRGLVKRATRELQLAAPELTEDPDGTVHATFADGIRAALPTGGLEAGSCSCGAPGVCRHLIGLVLAYGSDKPTGGLGADPAGGLRAKPTGGPAAEPTGGLGAKTAGGRGVETAGSPGAETAWSPGDFTDEELTGRIGSRMLATARRAERAGFVARVHRPRPGDPVAAVELPTSTVRFLVPKDLAFARTDAAGGVRDDLLALAVWAFRVADRVAPGDADAQVQVGGVAEPSASAALDAAVALADVVLRDGAVHVGAGVVADVPLVRRGLESARMRWPLLAVDDVLGQLDAYRERSARYKPEALADHLAELHARHRAVTAGGSSLRSRVLGTDEASETPLRRARLDGLGCRVSVVGRERVADIYLAHADSATVLVVRRSWETEETGPQLAARRLAGVTVSALAAGAVVTESAVRSASRTVRLGTRRLSRTEAMQSRGSWPQLPSALIADDLTALSAELAALPPRPLRARVEAEWVKVVPIAEVRSMSYAPGSQQLEAVIADRLGATAVVSATHAACAPGRLDSMAAALGGDAQFVAGSVRRGGGGVVIDPIAFAGAAGVVVPDLAPAARAADPEGTVPPGDDPLGQALDETISLLATIAHQGLLRLPATMPGRLRAAAGRLNAVGLRRAAGSAETLAARLGPDPGDAAIEAWVDAYLRLTVTADLR